MHQIQLIKVFCGLVAVANLVSCTNHHIFPADWSPVKTDYTNICPDISGIYKDLGISDAKGKCQVRDGYSYGYCYSLSAELLSAHIDTSETARVEIIQDGDLQLTVRVSDGQKEIHRQSLLSERGDYQCQKDGLWVSHPKRIFRVRVKLQRNIVSNDNLPSGRIQSYLLLA